jgi:3-dehydroquinate synthase
MKTSASNIQQLEVKLGDRSYPILIGHDLIKTAGSLIAPRLKGRQIVVITDESVAQLWLPTFIKSFEELDVVVHDLTLPATEETKSFSHFESLLNDVLALGIDRKTTLIALGGGVIGDIVGFTAAVLLRGIDFIQVPTTLLSQVDSSVGGKTGINTNYGKNLVGAFHQPQLVLVDTGSLATLPKRELLAGYAEVVKYGLIDDFDFYEWCENNAQAIIDGDQEAQKYAVLKSCMSKAKIVASDEHEFGLRALLNLGHTFGHAFEAETGYSRKLLHGEAVSIGCINAFQLSSKLGLCKKQETIRVEKHFSQIGLRNSLTGLVDKSWTVERLIAHMLKDKKSEAGKITFILARGIGKSFVAKEVAMDALKAILAEALANAKV